MGTVIIHPEPGHVKRIAQELLALADSPHQVEYVQWPEVGFRVPEELLNRWEAAASADPGIEEPVEPVKRKPGRPRKNVEGK